MNTRKILIITILFTIIAAMPAAARPRKEWTPIFIGKVIEVSEADKDESIRVRAKGFIKGCSVYEEELILIVTKDTEFIPDECGKEAECEKDISVGDCIFAKLDKAMTKSIPPQVKAVKIQVSKINKA